MGASGGWVGCALLWHKDVWFTCGGSFMEHLSPKCISSAMADTSCTGGGGVGPFGHLTFWLSLVNEENRARRSAWQLRRLARSPSPPRARGADQLTNEDELEYACRHSGIMRILIRVQLSGKGPNKACTRYVTVAICLTLLWPAWLSPSA